MGNLNIRILYGRFNVCLKYYGLREVTTV